MLKKQQIVVIGSVVILMGLLFSLDIKGLVKPAEQSNSSGTATPEAAKTTITLASISSIAKQSLSADLAQQINKLEEALQSASAEQKLELQKQLAQKWNDVNQPAPAAFYLEEVANKENTYPNWLKTADLFTAAYQVPLDTLLQPGLVQKAIEAYQMALKLDSTSLDAKAGLGTAYVTGTPNPMQGIQLLRAVVEKDPDNIKANMSLGIFSIQSGQFDKAVSRFKTVVAKKPDPEAWLLLARSYEGLGKKNEAIAAYEKTKELGADPGLTTYVDRKIEELKKN